MSFELIRPFLRPIEPLLLDDEVSEIMGNPNATWYAERDGKMLPQPDVSFEPGSLRTGLEVIANNLGKRLDEDNPVLETRLPDGSRICAYIPPAVKPSPGLTIRKFTGRHFTAEDLIVRGTITRPLSEFLAGEICAGKTILISGGTGTGKTTLLNVLAQAISEDERIVTIEDTAELLIHKPNLVNFECQMSQSC
ncbi:MAG TPA: ATPase, T2SS/T4P/T4SS family [Acidobacteriaceae bacterium]|nr:ATPase, T2SS/T4P/T4SS family [Acidobacteriaceae bacterium]